MPFGQVQDDDAVPNYHPFLVAAAGTAPAANGNTAQPAGGSFQPPYYSVAAPQMPAAQQPQQGQAMSSQTTAQGGQPQPATPPPVVLPAAPQAPASVLDRYHALEDQLQKDSVTQKVAPKWYDRLAGGMVGFGAGFRGNVEGGIRAGSAITDRGQIDADRERESRMAADRSAIDGLKQESQFATNDYENQVRSFDAQRSVANDQRQQNNADRTFNLDKTDKDRNFDRNTKNDTAEQDYKNRDLEQRADQFSQTNARESARDKETSRHNRADEGIAATREAREAKDDADRKGGKGPNTTVTPEQWQGLLKERDEEYSKAKSAMDDEMSTAKTPDEKQAIQKKYDAMAATMQNTWNGRLSTADPTGRYAQQNGAPAQKPAAKPAAQQTPAPAKPSAQPAQKAESVSLSKAMGLPQMKGKTREQVKQAILATGRKVID